MADGVMPAKSSIIDQDLGRVCIVQPSRPARDAMTGLCRSRLALPKPRSRHRHCALAPVFMPLLRARCRPWPGCPRPMPVSPGSGVCVEHLVLCTEIAYSLRALFLDPSQEASVLVPVRIAVFSVSKALSSCPALLIPHRFRVVNGWLRPSPSPACWR